MKSYFGLVFLIAIGGVAYGEPKAADQAPKDKKPVASEDEEERDSHAACECGLDEEEFDEGEEEQKSYSLTNRSYILGGLGIGLGASEARIKGASNREDQGSAIVLNLIGYKHSSGFMISTSHLGLTKRTSVDGGKRDKTYSFDASTLALGYQIGEFSQTNPLALFINVHTDLHSEYEIRQEKKNDHRELMARYSGRAYGLSLTTIGHWSKHVGWFSGLYYQRAKMTETKVLRGDFSDRDLRAEGDFVFQMVQIGVGVEYLFPIGNND